ncbi:acyl-CoA thioester hydrolase, YbgC/YbaW family [Thermoanaerobacter kivui]|uniref:Acyl-CoA thioester hydrolase, YbgC/YbaW family n=1 Tax=Thermoanaerobacter kivui TaxID=2325 RepID=A0A097ASS8_THEKI|nr:acyl-CoA thioester hydrolase, YbgC/YbaW family [Thermoanaerobacter kivui]
MSLFLEVIYVYVWDAEIRVRYGETDKMGIVYYANYFNWFEIGRTEFFRSLGMSYRSLEEKNVMLPVIDAQCKYFSSALYDDLIIIRTRLEFVKGTRLKFLYDVIRKEDNKLLAQGYTEHPFTNLEKKPINLKKVMPEVYDILMKCCN